jgi:hypothetical protein
MEAAAREKDVNLKEFRGHVGRRTEAQNINT